MLKMKYFGVDSIQNLPLTESSIQFASSARVMYTTKVSCNSRAADGFGGKKLPSERYLTIGDPYKGNIEPLPGRWRAIPGKQNWKNDKTPTACNI
jgi:hypothetical protein